MPATSKYIAPGLFAILLLVTARPGGAVQDGRLSVAEARQYMLELINRDRAALDLKPVRMDPLAAEVGQKHAEEMAVNRYMAHWDLAGKLPDQRYTEGGGIHHVQENVFLEMRFLGAMPTDGMKLVESPTFSRAEVESIEAAYFNERPPKDGHRRNILDPAHTHVGIALSRAQNADGTRTLANTQEFVNEYLELDPIPLRAKVGQTISIRGRVLPGARFRAVALGRDALPSPMTREELARTGSYHTPNEYVSFWPEPYVSDRPVRLTRDQAFSIDVPLSDRRQPGLYYVMVWVTPEGGKPCVASQRTVVVE